MLVAYKVKMSGSEKKSARNTINIFLKFHVVVVQNNGKEMYKLVCCMCKVVFFFLPIGPTEVFWLFSLPSPLSTIYTTL